jgi:uncharacterized protein DUF6152
MKGKAFVVLAAMALVAATVPAMAHHSVTAAWDPEKPIKVTGVVSKVDWINPHIYIYVDVKDGTGKVTTWALETIPTAAMRRAGVTRDMVMGGGKPVTVNAWAAKDGTPNLAWIIDITYPDGHKYQLYTTADNNGNGQ